MLSNYSRGVPFLSNGEILACVYTSKSVTKIPVFDVQDLPIPTVAQERNIFPVDFIGLIFMSSSRSQRPGTRDRRDVKSAKLTVREDLYEGLESKVVRRTLSIISLVFGQWLISQHDQQGENESSLTLDSNITYEDPSSTTKRFRYAAGDSKNATHNIKPSLAPNLSASTEFNNGLTKLKRVATGDRTFDPHFTALQNVTCHFLRTFISDFEARPEDVATNEASCKSAILAASILGLARRLPQDPLDRNDDYYHLVSKTFDIFQCPLFGAPSTPLRSLSRELLMSSLLLAPANEEHEIPKPSHIRDEVNGAGPNTSSDNLSKTSTRAPQLKRAMTPTSRASHGQHKEKRARGKDRIKLTQSLKNLSPLKSYDSQSGMAQQLLTPTDHESNVSPFVSSTTSFGDMSQVSNKTLSESSAPAQQITGYSGRPSVQGIDISVLTWNTIDYPSYPEYPNPGPPWALHNYNPPNSNSNRDHPSQAMSSSGIAPYRATPLSNYPQNSADPLIWLQAGINSISDEPRMRPKQLAIKPRPTLEPVAKEQPVATQKAYPSIQFDVNVGPTRRSAGTPSISPNQNPHTRTNASIRRGYNIANAVEGDDHDAENPEYDVRFGENKTQFDFREGC